MECDDSPLRRALSIYIGALCKSMIELKLSAIQGGSVSGLSDVLNETFGPGI